MASAQRQTKLATAIFEAPSFFADGPMAEAARAIFTAQLTIMRRHEAAVRCDADAAAIHETRKAIRRLRTAIKQFKPYFDKGILEPLQRSFKQSMRRMARSRDLTVFRLNLKQFIEQPARTAPQRAALLNMLPYWQDQQGRADAQARTAVARHDHQRSVTTLLHLANTPGMGTRPLTAPESPEKVRHLAPVHVARKLAAVRAYDDHVDGASVETLHRLRIRFKELRHTLEFFLLVEDPLIGDETGDLVAFLDQVQDHLGALNDARVALELLREMPEQRQGADIYRVAQKEELARLAKSFNVVWTTFDDPSWRRRLATALTAL